MVKGKQYHFQIITFKFSLCQYSKKLVSSLLGSVLGDYREWYVIKIRLQERYKNQEEYKETKG